MNLLDALNLILRAASQPQVNATTDENANIAWNVLKRERRSILSNGYHFNRDSVDLAVDTSDRVPLDRKFLKVRFPSDHLSFRDDPTTNKRYVWDTHTSEYIDYALPDVDVVFDIDDFGLIPEQFQRWIAAKAALTHWHDTHGANQNPYLQSELRDASARAINSLPSGETNVHGATGWRGLRAMHGQAAAVRVGGSWVDVS